MSNLEEIRLRKTLKFPISVFPLDGVVFYPATNKPLTISEPYFIEMVEDALRDQTPIAITHYDPNSSVDQKNFFLLNIRRIAGAGRPILLDRQADGSITIMLEGMGKVYLKEKYPGDKNYLQCLAHWIDEDVELEDQNRFLLNRLLKDLRQWLQKNLADDTQVDSFLKRLSTAQEKVNYSCSFMINDADQRQKLLEADSINDRLQILSTMWGEQRASS